MNAQDRRTAPRSQFSRSGTLRRMLTAPLHTVSFVYSDGGAGHGALIGRGAAVSTVDHGPAGLGQDLAVPHATETRGALRSPQVTL